MPVAESARERETHAQAMLKTLLVCDLVGSTRLVAQLGDGAAAELFQQHDRQARDLLEKHEGHEIDKTDGFLLLFDRPWAAVQYARDYHRSLAELGRRAGVELKTRVGVHVGEVILRQNPPEDVARGAKPLEVEGLAKLTAARLMSVAAGGQTLLSRSAFDIARRGAVGEGETSLRWLAHGAYELKGVEEPIDVFEVGEEGLAPLAAPADSDKVRRVVEGAAGDEILGWRPAAGEAVPRRPGWELRERLGEGGFGEVWLAANPKTGDRRIFKFCFSSERLASLEREITIFRLLKETLGERDDIARIYDWSFEEAPYFIEGEYTSGGTLEEWAEEQGGLEGVPLPVRLEIVAQVATALAAAHSVGVLHKDVKPANVLIFSDATGAPRARLTDFGIGTVMRRDDVESSTSLSLAGLFEDDGTPPTPTHPSTGSGTSLYLAPELLEGQAATVQADNYSLGVLLYQMVVGNLRHPLASGWQRDVEDPLLREDIAWVVDGSPQRRLGNALRLAERLRSLEERRRERAAQERAAASRARWRRLGRVGIAAAVVLAAFAAVVAQQSARVAEEAARATRAASRAEEVSRFLVELFQLASPSEARGSTITAREILDRGSARIESKLGDQPEVRAHLMVTIGEVYRGLGLYEAATPLVEGALEERRRVHGGDHAEVAESLDALAALLHVKGEYAASADRAREALEMRRRLFGDRHPAVADSLNRLALALDYQGDYAEAEPLYREALEMRRRLFGEEHVDIGRNLFDLGGMLWDHGRLEEAENLLRQSLTMRRRLLGELHPDVAATMSDLGGVLLYRGNVAAAEPLFREALALQRRLFGGEHPAVEDSLNNIGVVLHEKGDLEGAEARIRESVEMSRRLKGDTHPEVGLRLINLARVLLTKGDPAAAEPVIREALEIYRGAERGRRREIYAEGVLGAVLAGQGRYAEAEPLILEAHRQLVELQGAGARLPRHMLEYLADLYRAWGREDRAAEVRRQLEQLEVAGR